MPMYEYACRDCDHFFTARRNTADRDLPAECPLCAGRNVGRQLATFLIGAGSKAAAAAAADAATAAAGPRRRHSFGCPCCA